MGATRPHWLDTTAWQQSHEARQVPSPQGVAWVGWATCGEQNNKGLQSLPLNPCCISLHNQVRSELGGWFEVDSGEAFKANAWRNGEVMLQHSWISRSWSCNWMLLSLSLTSAASWQTGSWAASQCSVCFASIPISSSSRSQGSDAGPQCRDRQQKAHHNPRDVHRKWSLAWYGHWRGHPSANVSLPSRRHLPELILVETMHQIRILMVS